MVNPDAIYRLAAADHQRVQQKVDNLNKDPDPAEGEDCGDQAADDNEDG